MNKRKFNKLLQIILNTRINYDLLKYIFNKIKMLWLKLIRSNKIAQPSCIMLELTNHCNLHCITCPREYSYGQQMDKGYMPIEKAKKIINEAYPYLDSIGLTGLGETFLYPDLTEIAKYIKHKKKSIIISLSTNANIPNFIEKAKSVLPFIDSIQISIDGMNETYEQIRINGKFHSLLQNIHSLIPLTSFYNVDIMLNMVVTKENYTNMPYIIDLAQNIGIKYLYFSYLNLTSINTKSISYYDFYNSGEFLQTLKEAKTKQSNYSELEIVGLENQKFIGFKDCRFPWSHFYITWNGYVAPCCAKPFPKILNFGNAFNHNLLQILNSKNYQDFRKMWRLNQTPNFCKKCTFIHLNI